MIAKVEWHPGELYPRVGFIVTNLSRPVDRVVASPPTTSAAHANNGSKREKARSVDAAIVPDVRCQRGSPSTSCAVLQSRQFPAHAGRRPEPIKDWSLTSLKEKLIKIGAKVVSHGRFVAFQMAEVAIPRQEFQEILRLIAELRPQPPPAPA